MVNRIVGKYSRITLGAFITLLGLQFVTLSELYNSEREKHTFLLNNILHQSVGEFNTNKIISDKSRLNYIGWREQDKNVTIIKQGSAFRIPIAGNIEKDEIVNIGTYDIRDTTKWHLAALDSLFQEKLKETGLSTPVRWLKKDSLGKVLEVWGHHKPSFLSSIKAIAIQLGFLEKHVLESDFEFSFVHFTLANYDRIITILGLLLILGYCITTLYLSIKTEKKVGKYREQFTHALVHDLKTPVQVIKKDEYLLRRYLQGSIEERIIKQMDTMKQDLEVLSQKINTLQTMMITVDGFKINAKTFSLNELLEDVQERHQKIAPDNKEIIYCSNCPPEIDTISADPNHLYEALGNLLENAIKYSGKQVKINVTCKKINSGIQISVKDNGFGISKEDKKHIFEKNYRANQSNTIKGFGLGLHYVEMVAYAHKGKVEVQSEVGKGSEFIITIPQKQK